MIHRPSPGERSTSGNTSGKCGFCHTKRPPAAYTATDGLFLCFRKEIPVTSHLTEHLQHSTGHQDPELFSDIWQNLDRTGQATGRTRKATGQACCPWWVFLQADGLKGQDRPQGKHSRHIPDGDLLTIANCGLPVVW